MSATDGGYRRGAVLKVTSPGVEPVETTRDRVCLIAYAPSDDKLNRRYVQNLLDSPNKENGRMSFSLLRFPARGYLNYCFYKTRHSI